jgi:hypothetical protein
MADSAGYLQLETEVIISPAALDLSPLEFRLLVEIQRAIKAVSGIGRFGVADKKTKVVKEPKPVKFSLAHLAWKCSPATFYAGLAALEDHGFITVERPGYRKANTINWSNGWKTWTSAKAEKSTLKISVDRKAIHAKKPSRIHAKNQRGSTQEISVDDPQIHAKNQCLSITKDHNFTTTPPQPADDDGVGVGVSSVLASLGTAIEANEHDPEHQRAAAAFERSLHESTTAQRAEQAKRQVELAQRQSPEAISAMVGISVPEAQEWIGRLGAPCCHSVAEAVIGDKSVTSPAGAFRFRARREANKCTRKVGAAC